MCMRNNGKVINHCLGVLSQVKEADSATPDHSVLHQINYVQYILGYPDLDYPNPRLSDQPKTGL